MQQMETNLVSGYGLEQPSGNTKRKSWSAMQTIFCAHSDCRQLNHSMIYCIAHHVMYCRKITVYYTEDKDGRSDTRSSRCPSCNQLSLNE
jgi:hypothetical protein